MVLITYYLLCAAAASVIICVYCVVGKKYPKRYKRFGYVVPKGCSTPGAALIDPSLHLFVYIICIVYIPHGIFGFPSTCNQTNKIQSKMESQTIIF